MLYSNKPEILRRHEYDEEVIAETESYFEAKCELNYKNDIENSEHAIIGVSPSIATVLPKKNVFFFKMIRTFQLN